jgi:ComF family protein
LKNSLGQYIQGLVGLIYPRYCAACGNTLLRNEEILCLNCYVDLPKTGFHSYDDNDVARLFWGRIPVRNATAFIFFNKDSHYKNILHEIKYMNQQHVGFEMGRLFGLELRFSPFAQADVIVPVPLHRKKMRQRGYNQSELIARGLSEVLHIPVATDLVVRTSQTPTQTRKTRYERWENVRDKFQTLNPHNLVNKHVLLVDDVITTGATIEACATAILAVDNVSLSVASLACAKLQ